MLAPLPDPDGDAVRVDAAKLFAMRHIVRHVPERALAPTGRPGGFAGRRRGNGLEIVDVRQFCDGDDMRHIDAAATARTARTHVRTFRDERDRAALLIADFRAPMYFGTRVRLRSVAAAGALALAGWRVVEAGGRVGLLSAAAGETRFLPPRPRERAMAAIAGDLESAHAAGAEALGAGLHRREPSLAELLEEAVGRASPGTSLLVATGLDDAGEDFYRLAGAACRRFSLTVLLVRDRFETAPPEGAYPYRIAGEAGAGPMGWAVVARSRGRGRGKNDAGTPGATGASGERPSDHPDERVERLASAGVTVRRVASDGGWEAIAADLEGVDGRRS
ncbi:DUF58 domain-containing protein [Aurantimonas sp. 22II-16-19i]|uniref:DUF58 domain-containing protein n=1 Tax=Aurantimonas sp. 22II-16-19i TaxID=1317114 RepID=UPI0009F7A297|nr:DUF58 domain-containing protein [Aurantimonas sp. 22II-16-19i]ORE97451.1 hypothetical protein ATO4_09032 [Aurantimonas sp. 22II-16-19i]